MFLSKGSHKTNLLYHKGLWLWKNGKTMIFYLLLTGHLEFNTSLANSNYFLSPIGVWISRVPLYCKLQSIYVMHEQRLEDLYWICIWSEEWHLKLILFDWNLGNFCEKMESCNNFKLVSVTDFLTPTGSVVLDWDLIKICELLFMCHIDWLLVLEAALMVTLSKIHNGYYFNMWWKLCVSCISFIPAPWMISTSWCIFFKWAGYNTVLRI